MQTDKGVSAGLVPSGSAVLDTPCAEVRRPVIPPPDKKKVFLYTPDQLVGAEEQRRCGSSRHSSDRPFI